MKLELTKEQHQWVDQWLQLWGAWSQTGKIDKAMINMIARFMATVEPQEASRPVCSDDDGMLRRSAAPLPEEYRRERMAGYLCLLRLQLQRNPDCLMATRSIETAPDEDESREPV